MITRFRRLLIQIGKMLPFAVCFLVCLHYIESAYTLFTVDWMMCENSAILNTRISFYLARYFEYNAQMLAVLVIISFAVETCVYNKLACLYLLVNLVEKSYFDFELEPNTIYIICLANIIVSGYLTFIGIRILTK